MIVTRSRETSLIPSIQNFVMLSSVLETLRRINDDFNRDFDEDESNFICSIQEQRRIRQLIIGWRIEYVLLVLIRYHMKLSGETIIYQASRIICLLHNQEVTYDEYSWQTEAAIASQIIRDFPNLETLYEFINDYELLSHHIHMAARNYLLDQEDGIFAG